MLQAEAKVAEMRKFLEQIYNDSTGKKEEIKSFTDVEVLDLAHNLQNGVPFATPVFDGAAESDIKAMLDLAFPDDDDRTKQLQFHAGKTQVSLFDGRTGDKFERPVTVGYMHVLKLHHLVDDKMHARSTGPYSWSRNNHWAVKHNSVVNVLVRWRFGRLKLMAHPTPCKRCLLLSQMTSTDVLKFMKILLKVNIKLMPECLNHLMCW